MIATLDHVAALGAYESREYPRMIVVMNAPADDMTSKALLPIFWKVGIYNQELDVARRELTCSKKTGGNVIRTVVTATATETYAPNVGRDLERISLL